MRNLKRYGNQSRLGLTWFYLVLASSFWCPAARVHQFGDLVNTVVLCCCLRLDFVEVLIVVCHRLRFGTGADVQRRVGAGEPPPGRGLQAAAERRLRHLRQSQQKAAPNAPEDGHRHGAPPRRYAQSLSSRQKKTKNKTTKNSTGTDSFVLFSFRIVLLFFFWLTPSGSGHRHVEAHEPFGRPQDDGGDEESGRLRRPAPRQLHGPHPGRWLTFLVQP